MSIEKCVRDEEKTLKSILGSDVLAKACIDSAFNYALKLRTGETIRFTGAELIDKEWICLYFDELRDHGQPHPYSLPFMAKRGVDVRISDIVWAIDAPDET